MGTVASSVPCAIGDLRSADALRSHYRCPPGLLKVHNTAAHGTVGFFRFGTATCFGSCSIPGVSPVMDSAGRSLPDALGAVLSDSGTVALPFDLNEVADNLRLERYAHVWGGERRKLLNSAWIRRGYYLARKFMPIAVRKHLQRMHLADWRDIPFPSWPTDCSVELMFEQVMRLAVEARGGDPMPFVWFWPDRQAGCMIMTHDVEHVAGRDFCSTVMNLDESAGMRSSFQVIPEERYDIPLEWLEEIRCRGHEVNIHDLNHDGHLFPDRKRFVDRAERIRFYAQQFGAEGFRSGALYRNLQWYDGLSFSYDMSVPNVAHLDPQHGGCCTVMPYFIGRVLELPLTTTQDYSLFHIIGDYALDLWERQIDIILARQGLLSFNIHPDYLMEERALAVYVGLLSRLAQIRRKLKVWAALPGEVNSWWRQRSQMELVADAQGNWRIVGEGSERASLAYAAIDGGNLVYRFER